MKSKNRLPTEVCRLCGKKVSWHFVQEVTDKDKRSLEEYKVPFCKSCRVLDVPVKINNGRSTT